MQRLWARVLKGQAAVSGSYSIHTLEFLSRMSRDDAELLAKLGCFALDNACVYSGSKVLEAALTFDHILYLADLGLLSGVAGYVGLTWNVKFQDRPQGRIAMIRLKGKCLVFEVKDTEQKDLNLPSYPMSVVARELLTLAECEPNLEYLKEVADVLRDKVKSVGIGDLVMTKPKEFVVKGLRPL